jgi:hypothetical protein
VAKINVKCTVSFIQGHLSDHLPVKGTVNSALITARGRIRKNKSTLCIKIVNVSGIGLK